MGVRGGVLDPLCNRYPCSAACGSAPHPSSVCSTPPTLCPRRHRDVPCVRVPVCGIAAARPGGQTPQGLQQISEQTRPEAGRAQEPWGHRILTPLSLLSEPGTWQGELRWQSPSGSLRGIMGDPIKTLALPESTSGCTKWGWGRGVGVQSKRRGKPLLALLSSGMLGHMQAEGSRTLFVQKPG